MKIMVTGFVLQKEARDFIKNEIRFLPSRDIEVWLTDSPGILIESGASGYYSSDYADSIDETEIWAMQSRWKGLSITVEQLSQENTARVNKQIYHKGQQGNAGKIEGKKDTNQKIIKLECLYSGLF